MTEMMTLKRNIADRVVEKDEIGIEIRAYD